MPVIQGKKQGQNAAMLSFATKEDPFPRDKGIFEDGHGIGHPLFKPLFEILPGPHTGGPDYQFDPFPVPGNGKSHGPVLLFRKKRPCGHHQYLIRLGRLGVVNLTAPNHNTIALTLHHAEVGIRVLLLTGSLGSVALHVCLGTTAHQVFPLETFQPLEKILIVFGGTVVALVRLIRYTGYRIRRINSHASLNTAAHSLAEKPRHILFLMKVFLALVNM